MSVKGDKGGLRRKLTGPPRLLLGKSKARSDTASERKTRVRGHKGSRGSNGTQEDSAPGCQAISEEVPPKSAAGGIQLPPGLKHGTLKPDSSTGATMSPSIEQSDNPEAVPSDRERRRQTPDLRKGWKRLFFPSLACVRRLRRRTCEKVRLDEGEGNDVTFFNRQTRDSVDLTAQATAVHSATTGEEPERDSSPNHATPTAEPKETLKVRSWRIFRRLMRAPGKKKTKTKHAQLGPGTSLQDDAPCVIFSFKKRSEQLWRHRTTKPSPFFQERIGDAQEYIEEETIVLANRHADGVAEATGHGAHPHAGREVKGQGPETLTVSADVSAMTSEVKEVQNTEETEAYETLTSTAEEEDKREETRRRSLEEGLTEAEEMLLHPYPSETLGGLESDALNLSKELGVQKHPGASERITSSAPLSPGDHIRSSAPDKNDDSNADVSEAAFVHIHMDVTEENIPTGITANSDGDVSDDVKLCPVDPSDSMKNGSGTFHRGVLSAGDNGDQGDCSRDCDPQQEEILLLETACSVVQAVVRAALDQLTDEVVDSVTTLNQEAGGEW